MNDTEERQLSLDVDNFECYRNINSEVRLETSKHLETKTKLT